MSNPDDTSKKNPDTDARPEQPESPPEQVAPAPDSAGPKGTPSGAASSPEPAAEKTPPETADRTIDGAATTDAPQSAPTQPTASAADARQGPPVQPVPQASGGGEDRPVRLWPLWLVCILVLILSLLLGAGGWMLWQQQQQLRTDVNTLSELRDSVRTERERILDEASTRLRETLALTEERQKATEERLQAQLSQLAAKVLQQSATSRTDWLLAEAEYLLRLANQRLALERDVKGAAKLLEAADAVVAEADDPALYPVREALAQELAALKATGLPDRTGLFLRLNALAAQVDKLNQRVFVAPVETATSVGDASATAETSWDGRLARLKQQVEKYLVIRRLDAPVEPLLSPDQIAYLKANLRLMLEQAQLAVLQQNQEVYQASLDKASEWLQRWLVGQDASTRALLNELEALRKVEIRPGLPDISGSLRLLKGVIRQMDGGEAGK
ncbi:uroporphyrinogen-III C-methyltransferase [Hahella sp. SMD15-11]|uniref:Uroporphyrinogen-III C-methyltransferase n=1 Tax=Thermohahella caldifontis TaxID=3142973 RepID=A0AB39UTH0_9GAMM